MFWTPNGLNELPEVRFEFPFNLIGDHDKQNKAFLTGQSWRVLKSGYTAGSPEQGFRRCFADGVNQSLISSARRLALHRLQFLWRYVRALSNTEHGLFYFWVIREQTSESTGRLNTKWTFQNVTRSMAVSTDGVSC